MITKSMFNSWVYDSTFLMTLLVANMSSCFPEEKVHRIELIMYQKPDKIPGKLQDRSWEKQEKTSFSSFTFLLLIFAKDYCK